MSGLTNERVAYFNGEYMPESQVLIPFRDRGFKYGEAVFDTTRTVRHKTFRLSDHISRLFRSMRYLGIDSGMTRQQLMDVSEEVVERNIHLLDADEDYWLSQRVTPGAADPFVGGDQGSPTVIVECVPLPLGARAPLFRDGVRIQISATRRTPPDSQSPRAKTHNYINLLLADREVRSQDPGAWAVLLDHNGNIAEGLGTNIFFVREGVVMTPRSQMVLPGVSRQTVIELIGDLKLPFEEVDIDLYDAFTADECFMTSTSLCMVPVSQVNGRRIGQDIAGPITIKLMNAYKDLLDFDFVAQYLRHLKN